MDRCRLTHIVMKYQPAGKNITGRTPVVWYSTLRLERVTWPVTENVMMMMTMTTTRIMVLILGLFEGFLTYLHTPWSRVLLEELTGQEIPCILWNPMVY